MSKPTGSVFITFATGAVTRWCCCTGGPSSGTSWRKNIPVLAESFDVVAPDLRGFGDSDKPGGPPEELLGNFVEDLRALADSLGFERFGVVSHDVGAYVAQGFARKYPERLSGLFFFNCPYPGIGRRWADAESINEIWYQTFNQQPWAASLVGENRKTCETYFRHFLDHWAHEPGLFDEDLDLWVDNFMKPGNLQGGFNWYISTNRSRLDLIRNGPPQLPKIETPTRVRWGESDPILKVRVGRPPRGLLRRPRFRPDARGWPLRPLRAARPREP